MKWISSLMFLSLLCTGCVDSTSLTSTSMAEGHETGNGTDNVPFEGAWVLGDESEIRYCTFLSPDFGKEQAFVDQELTKAFTIWINYIQGKRINAAMEANVTRSLSRPPIEITPNELAKVPLFKLPVKAQRLSQCDGSQNVTFYFGAEDQTTQRAKKKYYNPTAFAERLSKDAGDGAGKGVVWLANEGSLLFGKAGYPMWDLKNRVLGVLLHEIGHVYGVDHIEDTIMRKDMWGLMVASYHTTASQEDVEYQMSHIDHSLELFVDESAGAQVYTGDIGYSWNDEQIENGKETFKIFTGRDPVGKITSTYVNGQLKLKDDLSEEVFDVKIISTHYSGGLPIFKVWRTWYPRLEESGLLGQGTSLQQNGWFFLGRVQTFNGTVLTLEIEKNQHAPMDITFNFEGEPRALLVMKRYW